MDANRLEHLKMVQAAITRMAQNSFVLKGWSVTLTTGILAAALGQKQQAFAWLGLVPALAFWGLDSFYLRLERRFRALHDDVCAAFGTTAPATFSMNTANVTSPPPSWWRLLFSKTVAGLHAPLVAVIIGIALWMNRDAFVAVISCMAQAVRGR